MISLLFMVIVLFLGIGLAYLCFIIVWRAMRAHESIADSMKSIAQQMGNRTQN